ncbi:S1 family peptidase [Dyadobacter diqingensis]|uniref:S1 family peptidase n=1 Tax=Dyadobacter diqingensis TaxID=2938121 RepID=UPI0020C19E0E|nr:serine protease [Dyadobacter diqingensis]
MLLGLTSKLSEGLRIQVSKKKRLSLTAFSFCFFLPLLTCLLFYTGVLKGRPMFDGQIQEPVAKIVTSGGVGTGFLISSTQILTARHVVENVKSTVQVTFEKAGEPRTVEGKVRYIAPSNGIVSPDGTVPIEYFLTDFAVITIQPVTDIIPLDLGESDGINPLDEVILIGYPGGDYSITKGNINSDTYQGQNLFKLDAASNPGNSGGPCILKDDNTVIGILVGGGSSGNQGENIALKISTVKALLKSARITIAD